MLRKMTLMLFAAMLLGLCACDGGNKPAPAEGGSFGAGGSGLIAVEYPDAPKFGDYDALNALREANPVNEAFVASVRDFSYRTASAVLSSAQENANYSPLSLYFALSLAGTGAAGETQEQLFTLLGVSSAEELSEQAGNLYRLLYADNEVTRLKIANSLWLDTDVAFREDFVQNAAVNFYASAHTVDFSEASSGEAMARWVSENSNGTLSPSFPPDPDKILSILNTVYFYDQWTMAFSEGDTASGLFHAPDTDITIDFMNRGGTGSFSRGAGFTRASLGLKGSGSMTFVLPDEGVELSSLTASPDSLRELFEGGEELYGEVLWKVPKFSFDANYELADMLKTVGVTAAFETDADFSGITDIPACLSSVTQQTHIAIDEYGVEASASTELGFAATALPRERADMFLDHPFLYAITDADGTPLFIGVCRNPSAQN